MNKIQKFITDNNIDLSGSGSDLNGQCVILAGYALYENGDTNDFNKLLEDIEEGEFMDLTIDAEIELGRVFDYAYQNDYFAWWKKPEAHGQYIFE